MANAKQHFVVAAAVAGVGYLAWKGFEHWFDDQLPEDAQDHKTPFSLGELALWSAAGGCIGLLPDILEPATTPNHRSFFHSFSFIALAAWLAFRFCRGLSFAAKVVLALVALPYLSHLVLDARTKRGLPLMF